MFENQGKAHILIRYPQIRGYILKAHELKQMIAAHYEANISLEEHAEYHLALILDGKQIYTENAKDQEQVDHMEYIEIIRRHNITERKTPLSPFESEREIVDDPDHHHWINNVCSGE